MHLLGDLADAQTEASQALGAYIDYLETDVGPRARASFRLGREKFEQKLKFEEGIGVPIERLLAIAERELHTTQEAFRTLAGRLDGTDPLDALGAHQGGAPGTGPAHRGRPPANRRAGDVPPAQRDHLDPDSRSDHRRADPRLLSLVVREHVDRRVRSRPSRRAPTTI